MRIPVTPIREEISTRLDRGEFITSVPGISLIEKRNSLQDGVAGFNCVRYCFGKEKPTWINVSRLPKILALPVGGYLEVKSPKEGDLAVYVSKLVETWGEFSHVGKVTADCKILSKWCYGNVYLHFPELVPIHYGAVVRFFRKKT